MKHDTLSQPVYVHISDWILHISIHDGTYQMGLLRAWHNNQLLLLLLFAIRYCNLLLEFFYPVSRGQNQSLNKIDAHSAFWVVLRIPWLSAIMHDTRKLAKPTTHVAILAVPFFVLWGQFRERQAQRVRRFWIRSLAAAMIPFTYLKTMWIITGWSGKWHCTALTLASGCSDSSSFVTSRLYSRNTWTNNRKPG